MCSSVRGFLIRYFDPALLCVLFERLTELTMEEWKALSHAYYILITGMHICLSGAFEKNSKKKRRHIIVHLQHVLYFTVVIIICILARLESLSLLSHTGAALYALLFASFPLFFFFSGFKTSVYVIRHS